MSSALFALAPVFGMIVIGYGLKRRGFVTDAFWEPAEKLTFYILFPSLLVTKIGGAQPADSHCFDDFGQAFGIGGEFCPPDGFHGRRQHGQNVRQRQADGLGANIKPQQALTGQKHGQDRVDFRNRHPEPPFYRTQ